MHNSSAGNINQNSLTLEQYLRCLNKSKQEISKCPTPRPSKFSLDLIAPLNLKHSPKGSQRFSSLESSARTPSHRRQPSIMFKNLSEIYSFPREDTTSNSMVEEEASKRAYPRSSIFASTTAPRSHYSSSFKNSCSEVEEEILESENTELADLYIGTTKADENYSITDLNTIEEAEDYNVLGGLPSNINCKYCRKETFTDVSIKLPTLPFWKLMCCISNVMEVCNSEENPEKFQEFQHRCHMCRRLVGTAYPG